MRSSIGYIVLQFQFQYGTIKSECERIVSPIRGAFQFQYGTIKRSHTFQEKAADAASFNSNMVQLRDNKGSIITNDS